MRRRGLGSDLAEGRRGGNSYVSEVRAILVGGGQQCRSAPDFQTVHFQRTGRNKKI